MMNLTYSYDQFCRGSPDKSWPPDIVFLHKVAHVRVYCDIPEADADRVLLLAAKPEFFVYEYEDDERRTTAMHVLCFLVRRMPSGWCESARPLLEDCSKEDSARCKKFALEALALLGCYGRIFRQFF